MSIDSQISETRKATPADDISSVTSTWQIAVKHGFDKIVALLALSVLSPLLMLIVLLIKLDSKGPVLFRQTRNGYGNVEFGILKFRTMYVMEDGHNAKQAERNDSRITKIGNILRKTSLDELPQLINILTGDMSLVGPRPHPVALNEKFRPLIQTYNQRCMMRPGLTGLAQISGYRGPTETTEQMEGRIEKDIEYIREWNLWLDIKIILLTPFLGLLSKDAF